MPKSVNRKAVEIPIPLHNALTAVATKRHDTTARLIAHALMEWLTDHHPDLAPKDAYLTNDQMEKYYQHWGHRPIKGDGYRRY